MFLILAMFIGFLCSRAIGSIAIFLFVVNALRDVHPKKWFQQKWWLLGLVWIGMYAVSWFWTDSQEGWNDHIQVKIPFLILPLGFAFLPRWEQKEIRIFSVILLGTIASGVLYSLSFLFRNMDALVESYKYSKILKVPVYGDHISFSTAVAVCVAWCFYSLPAWKTDIGRWLTLFVAGFFVIYLHILAAKTGLVILYVFLAACAFRLFLKNKWKGLLVIAAGIACIVITYFVVPTFHERVNYTWLTYLHYFNGQRDSNYSDAGRLISYGLSWKLIRMHPWIGVGAGDMLTEMSRMYDLYHPGVPQEQRLIPHNQLLTIALATGIPAMLAFIWWIAAPFRRVKKNREGFFFAAVWIMLLILLFTDPALEVQFGVFVYLFFLLLQRKLMLQETEPHHDQFHSHLSVEDRRLPGRAT